MDLTIAKENNPFKIEGIRQLIFNFKNELRYGTLFNTRNKYIEKVARYFDNEKLYDHDYEIHRASVFNWRETALVLGLYYLLDNKQDKKRVEYNIHRKKIVPVKQIIYMD
tara:strand:+ start:134 stop:463 length:330 start_codon:yes stop_codon:yes gene_type:complete